MKKITLDTASDWVTQTFGERLDSTCIEIKITLTRFLEVVEYVVKRNTDLFEKVMEKLESITNIDNQAAKIQGDTPFKGSKNYSKDEVSLGDVGSVEPHHLDVLCSEMPTWESERGFWGYVAMKDDFEPSTIVREKSVLYYTTGMWGIKGISLAPASKSKSKSKPEDKFKAKTSTKKPVLVEEVVDEEEGEEGAEDDGSDGGDGGDGGETVDDDGMRDVIESDDENEK